MPPSQLKRLKATLREQGIVGPQQSKKLKKKNARSEDVKGKKLAHKIALVGIREHFNPFEYKATLKGPKFESTSQNTFKLPLKRSGLIISHDEESRKEAYFQEKLNRNKVGGIIDKRFGENDPTLAPHEKMIERFIREKQTRHKNKSAFDLEDKDETSELTHLGRVLSLDSQPITDDFAEEDLMLSESEESSSHTGWKSVKRFRMTNEDDEEILTDEDEQPLRKKSKQEVMKELIAKSKHHKYERQADKDEDRDLREELDKNMAGIHNLLREIPSNIVANSKLPIIMDPHREPDSVVVNKTKLDKEYDLRLRQLAHDKRSQPTEKFKSEDEIASELARKLQELESKRLHRMHGIPVDSDDDTPKPTENFQKYLEDEDFGFGPGIKVRPLNIDLGVEDEDDFMIDDSLIASGSEIENPLMDSSNSDMDEDDPFDPNNEVTDTFAKKNPIQPTTFLHPNYSSTQGLSTEKSINKNLAFEFPCPQSHKELLETIEKISIFDLPTVVQRIRILHSSKLERGNKVKLGKFSSVLVDHIYHIANREEKIPFTILEALVRHVHSLAKSFPLEIAKSFREHLNNFNSSRALSPTAGDLVLLTAIGFIFPTSDHFHQVVTPAILSMGRYLGLKVPEYHHDLAIGSYICTLCFHYQRVSKRYIPETINFIYNTLCVLAPVKIVNIPKNFPFHKPKFSLRVKKSTGPAKKLCFHDIFSQTSTLDKENEMEAMKVSMMETNLHLLDVAVDLWSDNKAFTEVFQPSLQIIQHLASNSCSSSLSESTKTILRRVYQKIVLFLKQSKMCRRHLELHHHRPLAIKTSIPKFEESFKPNRHYDPDKTRTEIAKLKKEHKREKKSAIRELRKDARIYAVQGLKEKKERDAAYEKKYKRIVAEIQGEEGKEAKAYEKEKEWRKKVKK